MYSSIYGYTELQVCKNPLYMNPVTMESASKRPEESHNAHPNYQLRTEK